jgi:hypothetical protein
MPRGSLCSQKAAVNCTKEDFAWKEVVLATNRDTTLDNIAQDFQLM